MAKNLVLWLIIAGVLLVVFQNFRPQTADNALDYSDFILEVQSDKIREVTIDGLIIIGERYDGSQFEVVRPNVVDDQLMADLRDYRV